MPKTNVILDRLDIICPNCSTKQHVQVTLRGSGEVVLRECDCKPGRMVRIVVTRYTPRKGKAKFRINENQQPLFP